MKSGINSIQQFEQQFSSVRTTNGGRLTEIVISTLELFKSFQDMSEQEKLAEVTRVCFLEMARHHLGEASVLA